MRQLCFVMAKARHTILCIEDDDDTAVFVSERLTTRGFFVVVARSGDEGLLAMRNSPPDLVLYDLGITISEGHELIDSLNRMEPALGKTPLVLNTPVLPEHMTLDELRVSIMADIERLREMGVLNLPRLPQGVVANSNADLPMNGGSNDQAE